MFSVETVSSTSQFLPLRSAWNQLLERSRLDSPFLSHEWFHASIESYGTGKTLHILLLREDGDLVAIAPLWRTSAVVREIPVRRLEFVLCVDSPSVDFIVLPERRKPALEALAQQLVEDGRRGLWDLLTLAQWPADSSNRQEFRQILEQQERHHYWGVTSVSPYIAIQRDWESFLQTRSVKFRKTHRNIANRVAKLNGVEVSCFRESLDGCLYEDVVSVSSRGWKAKEGIAISNNPATRQFFQMLTEAASHRRWLYVWLLKVGSVPVAMEYDLTDGRKVFALRADFDEAYKECSPGAYLEYEIIKSLFDQGFEEYSTGPGLNTYKLAWTENSRENVELHWCNTNLKGRMIWTVERQFVPILKRVRDLGTRASSER